MTPEVCQHCAKALRGSDRALFVEEEVGRIFCSERCIAGYFTPEIERLEKDYYRRLSRGDLAPEDRAELSHLRWVTLQEPDEVWREKTLTGDYRYTLISEFLPGQHRVWCVCICLFLRGEPSFLYLSFPTRNEAMVAHYRRGERVSWESLKASAASAGDAKQPAAKKRKTKGDAPKRRLRETDSETESELTTGAVLVDRLADGWTAEETLRAQLSQERSDDDIPSGEYANYQRFLEQTLETPDEVWTLKTGEGDDALNLYHFIRRCAVGASPEDGAWYIIIARETEDDEQIEILDAFPTRDSNLVDRYRRGEQEIGKSEPVAANRIVH